VAVLTRRRFNRAWKDCLRSLLKNSNHSFCSGANALTSLRLHYRSLRICSVGAPRHYIRRARKLTVRNFSTDSSPSATRTGANTLPACSFFGVNGNPEFSQFRNSIHRAALPGCGRNVIGKSRERQELIRDGLGFGGNDVRQEKWVFLADIPN